MEAKASSKRSARINDVLLLAKAMARVSAMSGDSSAREPADEGIVGFLRFPRPV